MVLRILPTDGWTFFKDDEMKIKVKKINVEISYFNVPVREMQATNPFIFVLWLDRYHSQA